MPTALTAEQIVLEVREELQVPGSDLLVDGFPDDEKGRAGATRILPCVNAAKQQFHEHFITQCYWTKVLAPGQSVYRFAETDYTEDAMTHTGCPFGFIEEAFLVHPTSGKILPLDVTTNAAENVAYPYRNNRPNRRPFGLWVQGDGFGFDSAPDLGYTLRLLVDTLPAELTVRTSTPARLPYLLHRGLIAGGAYYLGRKLLAMPGGASFLDGRMARFQELKSEWNTRWIPLARELSNSRFIHAEQPVLSQGINWRR